MTEQSDEERITAEGLIVKIEAMREFYADAVEHDSELDVMFRASTELTRLIERLRATEARVDHLKGLHLIDLDLIADQQNEMAARDAVIASAPHEYECRLLWNQPCDCWKSAAPVSVLRERDAEMWWEGASAQWEHRPIGNRVLESENPHRAGADHDG